MIVNVNELPALNLLVGEEGDRVVVIDGDGNLVAKYSWSEEGALREDMVATDLLKQYLLGAVLNSGETL